LSEGEFSITHFNRLAAFLQPSPAETFDIRTAFPHSHRVPIFYLPFAEAETARRRAMRRTKRADGQRERKEIAGRENMARRIRASHLLMSLHLSNTRSKLSCDTSAGSLERATSQSTFPSASIWKISNDSAFFGSIFCRIFVSHRSHSSRSTRRLVYSQLRSSLADKWRSNLVSRHSR